MTDSIPTVDSLVAIKDSIQDTVITLEDSFSQALDKAEESLGISMLTEKGYDAIINYGPRLILAILTLIIGLYVIRLIVRAFTRVMTRRGVDESLKPFLRSLSSIGLKIMLIVSVMGMVGIEMTSFIAVLGAAGLAVGMALSGTLQNFAGGVIILAFKPFKAGDYVDAQGHAGTIKEIQIFNTIMVTPDNKTIIIPNGGLSTGSMTNYSKEALRRVDWTFGIAYGDNLATAKKVLTDLIEADTRILKEPAPFISISALADNSVNLVVRVWAKTSDYWDIFFDMNEKVYVAFPESGLNIPFPQMDVHLHQSK